LVLNKSKQASQQGSANKSKQLLLGIEEEEPLNKSKEPLMKLNKDYTQTMYYKTAFACLAASAIYMTWNSLPSAEAYLFISSFTALLVLTYLDVVNPDV